MIMAAAVNVGKKDAFTAEIYMMCAEHVLERRAGICARR